MRKEIFKKMMMLGAVSAMALGFTACSDDDDNPPVQPEVKINISQEIDYETLVSEGTFEVPFTITGIDQAPKASDFHIMPSQTSYSNMILDWDTTPAGSELPATKPAGLSVASIKSGEKDNSYVLTVKYDAKGVMSAEYNGCSIMYDTATSSNTFDFEYEGFAQESVGMDLATFSKAETGNTLSINIDEALAKVGITLDKFPSYKRSLYVGERNGDEVELMKSGEFSHEYTSFPSSGYGFDNNDGTVKYTYVKLSGLSKLPLNKIFELHLIICTEPGKYVAVNAPFMLTE